MSEVKSVLALIPDWMAGAGIFTLATAAAILIYLSVSKVVLHVTTQRASFIRSLFLRVRRILCLALVLLCAGFAAQLPYFPDTVSGATSKVMSVAIILLVGWSAIAALDVASDLYLRNYQSSIGDDLQARKHVTQVRVLRRIIDVLVVTITVAAALMAFEPVRQFGVSLFASAGAAGLVVGLAARPVLSNLIAGIQLAITQPIRINDAVLVEGEWGWIEEITSTYVVIKVWDWRRLIVPLSYFMEKPFQNWTRESSQLIGSVFLQADFQVPVDQVRKKLQEIVESSKLWDKNIANVQVTDIKENGVELRVLVSGRTSPEVWDLRCEVREKLLTFLQTELPTSLPRRRIKISATEFPALRGNGYVQDGLGAASLSAKEH